MAPGLRPTSTLRSEKELPKALSPFRECSEAGISTALGVALCAFGTSGLVSWQQEHGGGRGEGTGAHAGKARRAVP